MIVKRPCTVELKAAPSYPTNIENISSDIALTLLTFLNTPDKCALLATTVTLREKVKISWVRIPNDNPLDQIEVIKKKAIKKGKRTRKQSHNKENFRNNCPIGILQICEQMVERVQACLLGAKFFGYCAPEGGEEALIRDFMLDDEEHRLLREFEMKVGLRARNE